jgi:hypothetical protein
VEGREPRVIARQRNRAEAFARMVELRFIDMAESSVAQSLSLVKPELELVFREARTYFIAADFS